MGIVGSSMASKDFLCSSEKEISEGWWMMFIFNSVEAKTHLLLLRCLSFDKDTNVQWPKSRKLWIFTSKISKDFQYKSYEGIYVKLRFLDPTPKNSYSVHLERGPGICQCIRWLDGKPSRVHYW